jgi:ketosteroid isomerase-like protein
MDGKINMTDPLHTAEIRRLAKNLDDAVEAGDVETILSCFTHDCELEFLGIRLGGKAALQRAIEWMYQHLGQIKFEPVLIMVEGNTFFEEFTMVGQPEQESQIRLKATEILIYENDKVRTLRLYFDRLSLAEAFASGLLEKALVRLVSRAFSKKIAPVIK